MKALPSVLALMLLGACGDTDGAGGGETGAPATAAVAQDARIDCRVGGSEAMARVCTVERQPDAAGDMLVLRAPDGGFRRLRITTDGRGVIAADGAEPAIVTPLSERMIEVSIGSDAYRLPATVGKGTS
jgi:hypothetical protein